MREILVRRQRVTGTWCAWGAATMLLLGAAVAGAQGGRQGRPASAAATRLATLDRILLVEDQRGRGPDGIGPMLRAVTSADPVVRQVAVRGLGRLERPYLIDEIAPLLADDVPAVRADAANALAQALVGAPRGGPDGRPGEGEALADSVLRLLQRAARTEQFPAVLGAIARSVGRLPYRQPRQARDAEEVVNGIVGRAAPSADTSVSETSRTVILQGAAEALYTLARGRRTLGDLASPALAVLRSAAGLGLDAAATAAAAEPREAAARVRRLAWLALNATGTPDEILLRTASRDPDAQVRRLVVDAVPNVKDDFVVRELLGRARTDSAFQVRLEWVRVYRQLLAQDDCGPLVAALGDPVIHVRLAAIDALGMPCMMRTEVTARLKALADPVRGAGASAWHARAHALVALARVNTAEALPRLATAATDSVWEVRMYAARAAALVRDTATLARLAFDRVGSVREAAIAGLSTVSAHAADLVYVRALTSPAEPVVLAAARALKGTPVPDSVLPALLDALDRVTRERRETSRDPRLELLARIAELGDSAGPAPRRLAPYLRDFDPLVAGTAAAMLTRWQGTPVAAAPAVPRPAAVSLGRIALGPSPRLRITMAGGAGTILLRLDAAEAPASTARIIALARRRYYDGLTWHRVVPNFVVQGGSPGQNEYVGDGPFMRDELGLAHHVRGAVGISTRGRDTGDGQLFIDLVDNYRLDHDYTVVGVVESGMAVVDRLLEGDRIARVEVLPR